ncbi:MAG TPA: hopanoid biosynthesis associated radical SAM protein HpnJ [Thermodesulfovibrionia bacterium]|nr:hopanoid biosynthesis associated radical SAM protein HpnJ [Thermodesulfovibrionia bacterium]
MKLLLLNPPSYKNFDSGASSRWPATREIVSFWYPVWLCYPAGLIPESRVLDAPADGLDVHQVLSIASQYDGIVIFTSTPSLQKDIEFTEFLKKNHPGKPIIGFVGPHPTVLPEETLQSCEAIDFVVRREFDYPLQELAQGKPLHMIQGLSYRQNGKIVHNPDRPLIEDLDSLPFVTPIYHRDLNYKNYSIPFLLYPYIALFSGRGCPGRCIYCLWPQTISDHRFRTRSPENVVAEIEGALKLFPDVAEFYFDSDTFTANSEWVLEFCERIKPLHITWSGTSRANVSYEMLKKMKEAGLRLLVAGYESGNATILKNIKKGVSLEQMRRFTLDCKKLGILIHGAFILGLPEESHESIEDSIRFACELDPDTIQVSLAAVFPGTAFHQMCEENGYFVSDNLVDAQGYQTFNLKYNGIESREIYEAIETFYKRFYYRPKRLVKIIFKMIIDPVERRRRLKEAKEFNYFLRHRRQMLKQWR